MEQQKKKKREDYSGRRQSNSTSYFSIDLTTEILLRLPEKSVARFCCVSKLWSSITTDPYFIKLLETRSPRPSLLLCFKKDDNIFVSSIPQHNCRHTLRHNSNKSFSSSQPIGCYHMKFPQGYDRFSPTESVHGLICFEELGKPVIWNPSKREFSTLTKPRKIWNHITVLLGYDPIEGKHKVVCFPCDRFSHMCRVLTLGSAQESWRTVKTKYKHRPPFSTSGRCIKGFIYYLDNIYGTGVWVLMSFDVRFEKINMIQFDTEWNLLLNYGGRLACLDKYNKGRLWILKDAGEEKWSCQDFILPLDHFNKSFILKGITHAGEFIFAPTMFGKSSYIIYCDPVRNSFRRFELEGIVGNELGNDGPNHIDGRMFGFVFPNHIDGQISM